MQLPLLGLWCNWGSLPLLESPFPGANPSFTSYILLTSFLLKLQQPLVTINHPDTTQPISGEAHPDRLHLALALHPSLPCVVSLQKVEARSSPRFSSKSSKQSITPHPASPLPFLFCKPYITYPRTRLSELPNKYILYATQLMKTTPY